MTINVTSGTVPELSFSVKDSQGKNTSPMVRTICSICSTVFSPLTLALSQTALPSSPRELVNNVLTNSSLFTVAFITRR